VSTNCASPDGSWTISIARPPSTYDGPDHHRVADALGDRARLVEAVRGAPGGRAQAQLLEQLAEAAAILGAVDGVGAGPQQLDARVHQRHRQPQRRLAAELDDHAFGFSASMISSTSSRVSGSKNSRSDVS
jgi:hypothetical protein